MIKKTSQNEPKLAVIFLQVYVDHMPIVLQYNNWFGHRYIEIYKTVKKNVQITLYRCKWTYIDMVPAFIFKADIDLPSFIADQPATEMQIEIEYVLKSKLI